MARNRFRSLWPSRFRELGGFLIVALGGFVLLRVIAYVGVKTVVVLGFLVVAAVFSLMSYRLYLLLREPGNIQRVRKNFDDYRVAKRSEREEPAEPLVEAPPADHQGEGG